MKALLAALIVSTSFAAYACSSDEGGEVEADAGGSSSGHGSIYPSCAEISDACHPFDDGTPGPIHDCHELAHDDPTEPACVSKKAHCLAICTGDGGTDQEHDH